LYVFVTKRLIKNGKQTTAADNPMDIKAKSNITPKPDSIKKAIYYQSNKFVNKR
jgi:hypothetical protein